ncbi:type II toxin-antitoxin system RelE/ParE family toxin [Flavobacterium sp.]|jgi:plasmid stabilization system protein ParE|uniref:type II toxin-antitoxin system RelE/ParE family toxin n=1 Tax=Flavobacterium sp. TaxID=239 RepID=UPI002609C6C6|nr:type II toxin-antitoxin system RelE/ParE family toxin [Flavobacterium sp.]
MELVVYWTVFAEDKLNDIFEYYKFTAGVRVAQKLINGIVDSSFELDKNPYGGQKEELLKDRVQEYRYIIFKSYKIIYWIDETNKMIIVSHVFDTRRNPEKLNKI